MKRPGVDQNSQKTSSRHSLATAVSLDREDYYSYLLLLLENSIHFPLLLFFPSYCSRYPPHYHVFAAFGIETDAQTQK